MLDFKDKKKQKLLEVNNDMTHNYYYLIYLKVFNEEKTRVRKFRYVVWFDIFEVQEFFEKDCITENDIKEYLKEIVENINYTHISNIKNYNDIENIKNFVNFCNDTIIDYNTINELRG